MSECQGESTSPVKSYCASPQRSSAAELRELRRNLANEPVLLAALDATNDIALVLDENRQIVHCNRAALERLGIADPADLLGNRPGEALSCANAHVMAAGCGTSPGCRACGALRAILDCMESGRPVKSECRIRVDTADGPDTLELQVRATPTKLDGLSLVTLTATDVSAQKRREALERVFFHDALNLVSAIEGVVIGMSEDVLHATQAECVRLTGLVRQLSEQVRAQRDLAHAERGELRVAVSTFDAFLMLDELRCSYERHPCADGRTISCAVTGVVDLALQTDRMLLERVLGNLLKNALEASVPGERVRIGIEAADGDTVRFTVRNSAVIPDAVRHQVFQRSFTTKHGAGRGLGTFSVKLLTERYLGGRVEFTSDSNDGTTFSVMIPRRLPTPVARGIPLPLA